jgi:hypothetical protein
MSTAGSYSVADQLARTTGDSQCVSSFLAKVLILLSLFIGPIQRGPQAVNRPLAIAWSDLQIA